MTDECYICGRAFADNDHAVRVPVETADRASGETSWSYSETVRIHVGCVGVKS